jgi:hypothetical protein
MCLVQDLNRFFFFKWTLSHFNENNIFLHGLEQTAYAYYNTLIQCDINVEFKAMSPMDQKWYLLIW